MTRLYIRTEEQTDWQKDGHDEVNGAFSPKIYVTYLKLVVFLFRGLLSLLVMFNVVYC
jgi:hypothetical protein